MLVNDVLWKLIFVDLGDLTGLVTIIKMICALEVRQELKQYAWWSWGGSHIHLLCSKVMNDFFNLHCEKNNSAENLQHENYRSKVRKTFLLRKVIKNCNWLLLIKKSPFLNDTCASTYLKGCLLSRPRSKWLPSVLPKVLFISVNQEHMKRLLKVT